MASIAFPEYAKLLTLSTNHTYNYVNIPATGSHPTILFLHGFPSSCYDWRHQINFFSELGYGVLAPDLLGYGGTTKPVSPEEYKAKKMAAEITEILDSESIQHVHAVSHDTGSILLSRLATYFPERLLSCTFLAVPYSKPGEHFDLDAVNAMTKQLLGKERFGYLKFFLEDRAGDVLDQRSDSFFTLFYTGDPGLWDEHVGPERSLESWLQKDRRCELAPYITDEERVVHQRIMQGNHGAALNWYRVLVWNLNEQDELEAGLPVRLTQPILTVFPAPVPGRFSAASMQDSGIADDSTVKYVSTPGHWLQLEARSEVNAMLKMLFERCSESIH